MVNTPNMFLKKIFCFISCTFEPMFNKILFLKFVMKNRMIVSVWEKKSTEKHTSIIHKRVILKENNG